MKVVLLGDSIMLGVFTNAATLLAAGGRTIQNLSVSGQTAGQQLAVWLASSQRGDSTVGCAAIHVGINNVRTAVSVATTLADIDSIRADMRTNNPSMKIAVSLMLPARQHAEVAPRWASHWVPINAALTAATSLYDSILLAAAPAFDDGFGNLSGTYDSSDHLHPTPTGNQLHAKYLRQVIDDAMGLLGCSDIEHSTRSANGGWRDSLGTATGNGTSVVPGHKCPACP